LVLGRNSRITDKHRVVDELISLLFSFPYHMTVHTFFFLCADLPPNMNTSLISFQIASKPAAVPIPF
jgi:hypothetical protein